ncbi:MAG: hypothetical protein QOC96_2619 [Acidobacteriota bacterium]|jgi:hypothetical protein|nr:hypothetical protein [Acidobacteriota bacterium]
MAQKKTASKKSKAASKKGKAARYRLDKEGNLIGLTGRKVKLEVGDTPIVINGGSLNIASVGDLDDDEHPGQSTHSLHARDATKHISFIQLIGFSPDATNPNRFVPTNANNPVCHIFIHYE